ncbi:MAG: glutaminyl-peptide cyclotransferase [Pirellulales bacterium]|nr:glutaminyl-peptide cyclotransferase [Pirellulales bacterium]
MPHSFEIVNTFPHDTHAFCQGLDFDGEGWELTHDGNHLIMSDGSDTLRCLAAC